MTVSMSLSSI